MTRFISLCIVPALIIAVGLLEVEAVGVRFFFLRTGKPRTEISTSTPPSQLANLFNNKPVKFLMPGWLATVSDQMVITLTNSYLPTSVNIIQVDWTAYSMNLLYPYVLATIPGAGGEVADMIDTLLSANVTTLAKCHLIGFSLGAHLAGSTGSYFVAPKIGRITGLDPSGPGYELAPLNNVLDKTDAAFVDSIHTCSGFLGYGGRLAHLDFYPNRGTIIQPTCTTSFTPIACSHYKSYFLFAQTISSPNIYKGYKYPSWDAFVNATCTGTPAVVMGESALSTSPDGAYYLLTDGRPCVL